MSIVVTACDYSVVMDDILVISCEFWIFRLIKLSSVLLMQEIYVLLD